MALYDIDIAQFIQDVIPNSKRTKEIKAFLNGLLSGFSRTWLTVLDYMRGADVSSLTALWTAGTYFQYEQVIYLPNGGVYECVVSSTSQEPSAGSDWVRLLDTFIGVDESKNFTGDNLVLEYALNRRFNSTFNQEPTQSDTYIETVIQPDAMFQIGGDENNSSAIYSDTCTEQVTAEDTTTSNISMNIKIKTATWTTLGANDAKRTATVREFVDRYLTAGIYYGIIVY